MPSHPVNSILAAALDLLPGSTSTGTRTAGVLVGDVLLVVLAALVPALGFFFWAKYIRKNPDSRGSEWRVSSSRRKRSSSRVQAGEESAPPGAGAALTDDDDSDGQPETAGENPVRRRRRKRLRRDHRPRNPTLAETGGLPPEKQPATPPRPD